MITQTIEDLQPTANIFGNKFLRRHDLTTYDRLEIAYTALTAKVFGIWGTVTTLSKSFNISRTFVYDLLESFEKVVNELLGPPVNSTTVDDKKKSAEVMIWSVESSINPCFFLRAGASRPWLVKTD